MRALKQNWKRIFFVVCMTCCAAVAQESIFENWYEQGRDILRDHGGESLDVLLPDADAIDWNFVGRAIEHTLQAYSWEDVAVLQPQAVVALDYLDQIPGGEPYAAWLKQRLDYIEMANRVVKHSPRIIPPKRPKPTATPARPKQRYPATRRPTQTPIPKPTATPRVKTVHAAPNTKSWEKALKNRPAPKNARHLVPELKDIFKEQGVPPEWVWLAEVESSMNPKARSPVGAAGLFQFMPATAKRFGLKLSPDDDRLNPRKSARAAAKYLKILHRKFDDWPLALAAYNAGEGRVGKLLKRQNANSFEGISSALPIETQMYVPKVIAMVALRENIDPATLPAPQEN